MNGDHPMNLSWTREPNAHWDDSKQRIIGGLPEGIFDFGDVKAKELLPGMWWQALDGDTILGYGWMDCSWGEAEVLVAVDAAQQGKGVGSFIMGKLEQEARERGYRYVINVVRETHPDAEGLTRWLRNRAFDDSPDNRLMKKV